MVLLIIKLNKYMHISIDSWDPCRLFDIQKFKFLFPVHSFLIRIIGIFFKDIR